MSRYVDFYKIFPNGVFYVNIGDPEKSINEIINRINDLPFEEVVPKSEVEKIFEEIDNWFELYSEREYSFAEEETSKGHLPEAEAHDYALDVIKDLRQLCVAELKKKHTEGNP